MSIGAISFFPDCIFDRAGEPSPWQAGLRVHWQSLPMQAAFRLWEGYKAAAPIKRKARPSFFMGVLSGFGEKLEQSNPRMTLERSEKALINLGDRQLQEYTHYRHPKTTRRYWGTPLRDQQSYHAGKREGHRLNLHKPVCQKGAGQIKLLR